MRRGLPSPSLEATETAPLGGAVSVSVRSCSDRVTFASARDRRVGVVAKTAAVQFSCTECGYTAGRWFGKCPGCSAFGTLVEEVVGQVSQSQAPPKPLLRLVDVEAADAARISSGVPELDRVLGGGLGPGSPGLLGGAARGWMSTPRLS